MFATFYQAVKGMITLNRTTKVTTNLTLNLKKNSVEDIIVVLQEHGIDAPLIQTEEELSTFLNQLDESVLSDIFNCLFDYCSKEEFFSDENQYWVS